MSRSLIISLVATVVAGSAQAGVKQQASELFGSVVTKAAPYVTAKNAGIVAAAGVVGYGLKKAYNYFKKPAQEQSAMKGGKKNTHYMRNFGRFLMSRKGIATVAATVGVVGGAYYFRNGLSTVASTVWNAMPSKESVMSIKPMSFFSKNS